MPNGNRSSLHYHEKKTETFCVLDGYVKGNIQWIHKDYQTMKMDFQEEEFFEVIARIYKYRVAKSENSDIVLG